MATTTMQDTLHYPDGTAAAGCKVVVVCLSPKAEDEAYDLDNNVTIVSQSIATTDANGDFTIDLVRTSDITPSGSVYQATGRTRHGNSVIYSVVFDVPDSGPAEIQDNLTDPPGTLVSGALSTHINQVSGAHAASAISRGGSDVATDLTLLEADGGPLKVGNNLSDLGDAAGALASLSGAKTANVQVFDTPGSGTWTKPSGAKAVYVTVIAGGSGGGSGRKGAAGTIRCGGGGAAGVGMSRAWLDPDQLGATEDVVVGAGGPGGPGVSASSTNGATGTRGGLSVFGGTDWGNGKVLTYNNNTEGGGGTTNSGPGGSGGSGVGAFTGAGGGAASVSGGVGGGGGNALSGLVSAGGGAGGGIDAANSAAQGSSAGRNLRSSVAVVAGAAAGVDGTDAVVSAEWWPGLPGSGGGGGGGNGGDGAWPGGAGGGGGAGADGVVDSGAGGAGADGLVLVLTYF